LKAPIFVLILPMFFRLQENFGHPGRFLPFSATRLSTRPSVGAIFPPSPCNPSHNNAAALLLGIPSK